MPDRVALVLATSTGGVGRHVRALAGGLPARGFRVTVLGPADTDRVFRFVAAGAGFVPVEIAAGPRLWQDAAALRVLRAALPGTAVVHAHGLRAGLLAGLARPAGTPLVLTLHNLTSPGAVLGGRGARTAYGGLERVAVRRAQVVLAASADLAERARRLGAADVRLAPVAAPALPAPARSPAEVRVELGAGDRPLVVAVARLHRQKGLDVLVRAAARLADRTPPPLVVVAGDGPEEAPLRRLIATEAAPVRLLGRRDDVAELLAAADVVALPSRWEARALVAQEALRAGRPLVATAVGGLPDLLGDAARLVPPDDPAALAAALGDLLDDPAGAAALADRGRRRAADWPTEADMLAALAALYRELARR